MAVKDKLMDSTLLEGVVMTGKEFLTKWKTSMEDESKGHKMLTSLLRDYSNRVLELCGVNREMLELLLAVSKRDDSGNPRTSSEHKTSTKKTKAARPSVIDETALVTAYQSAETKFDAAESYFSRDARDEIIALLITEVAQDVDAKTTEKITCVTRFVKKQVGKAFGK